MSYAIPTKNEYIQTLPLSRIKPYVDAFLNYASENPTELFELSPIGCGLAGYSPADIAPMFVDAPSNVELPRRFTEWLNPCSKPTSILDFLP